MEVSRPTTKEPAPSVEPLAVAGSSVSRRRNIYRVGAGGLAPRPPGRHPLAPTPAEVLSANLP